MPAARIIATGSYAPSNRLTNAELAGRLETSDEWIKTRTGIDSRHIAAPQEQTSDLAVEAAKRALETAEMSSEALDMIIVGTISGDMPMPACAAFVAEKLGARCPAFDVSAACAASVFGLSIADAYIRSGSYRRILVVGVELLSRLLDWQDRSTCVLFGDAAGAMLLGPSQTPGRGILSTHIHTDGRHAEILRIPGGGSRQPVNEEMLRARQQFVHMNGREVFRVAVRNLVEVAREALSANALQPGDISRVIPHQANIRILEAVMDRLEIPMDRAEVNIHRYGNTSSASVPVTLDEAVRAGRVQQGDLVLMMAIGAGMSWGSSILAW